MFGYLRETKEKAIKAGKDANGLIRTGLDEYLEVIFPNKEWIHDKVIPNSGKLFRPDYRCEELKLIVEFDGVDHYTNPKNIFNDEFKTNFYEDLGYKVVRIPFFIQLSNDVVKELFNVECNVQLFDYNYCSFNENISPAYFCPLGIQRCMYELKRFPEIYEKEKKHLQEINIPELTGIEFFE